MRMETERDNYTQEFIHFVKQYLLEVADAFKSEKGDVTYPVIVERTREWAHGEMHNCDLKMTMENGDVLCLRAYKFGEKIEFYATAFIRYYSEGKRVVSHRGIFQDKPFSISFDLTEHRVKEAIKKFIKAHRDNTRYGITEGVLM